MRGYHWLGWVVLAGCIVIAGCSRTWHAPRLAEIPLDHDVPGPETCKVCHAPNYDTWSKTDHADNDSMTEISVAEFRDCRACHSGLEGHAADPTHVRPVDITTLTTAEQNTVCGKCHFSQAELGGDAINPTDRHGMFMSVGFAGKKTELSCLDCHTGHRGKSDMLRSIRAHACFSCHKEAILTMGVFQPFNYLAAGKLCFGCHTVHDGSMPAKTARMAAGITVTCVICHPTLNLDKTWF